MSSRPLIAITLGDPCGIGPEVVAKTLNEPEVYRLCRPLVVGSVHVISSAVEVAHVPITVMSIAGPSKAKGEFGLIEALDPENLDPADVTVGQLSEAAGRASVEWALEAGKLALNGQVQAMATAPINKKAASMAGYKEVGHMELLQGLSGAENVATMLMARNLRVVHLTTHRSLRRACDVVTKENVLGKLVLTHQAFQAWGFPRPRIGVSALNPHASDGGLLGTEEQEHIAPAVAAARERGIDATGPMPADIIFHQAIQDRYDVVLAMYHDQGHIPVKVYGFEQSISVNLGLPFIRTSVDHGTAFDIAGKGIADHQSMLEAVRVAATLAGGGRLP